MKALRAEEEWARDIISQTLSLPVEQHDDGSSNGMHDLWILHGNAPLAAVEVTAAADPESMKLWRLVNSGDRWIVDGLVGGWAISLVPSSARAKWRVKQFPAFLSQLEEAGVRAVDVEEGQVGLGRWQSRARDLGIASAFRSGTEFPGSVYISIDAPLERSAGFVALTGDPIAAWVGTFLQSERPDVVAKLGRSGAKERHAFVLVPGFTTAPFVVSELLTRKHAALPVEEPDLPIEVTHVWIVGMWHDVEGCCWAPHKGWSAVRTPHLPL